MDSTLLTRPVRKIVPVRKIAYVVQLVIIIENEKIWNDRLMKSLVVPILFFHKELDNKLRYIEYEYS